MSKNIKQSLFFINSDFEAFDEKFAEIMPEESKNAAFYEKFGFKIMADGVAMQLCNFNNQH